MNINSIIYMIIVFSVVACKDNQWSEKTKEHYVTYINYKDSLYSKALDTIKVSPKDTMTISKLEGYYKIIDSDGSGNYYSMGLLNKGVKVETWKEYRIMPWKEVVLNSFGQYKNGKLNGKYVEYGDEGNIIFDFNYLDDQQVGVQKKYNPEGKLVWSYTLNEDENFIDDYLALNAQGDTLYYTNFGKESTGYLKRYSEFGALEMEGKIEKGKMDNYIEYEYDRLLEKYTFKKYFIVTDSGVVLQKKVELK